MRIMIVSFCITNGGDFLIQERISALIHRTFPDSKITSLSGFEKITLKEFNSQDLIITGGGPCYDDRIIKELYIPCFNEIDFIKPPIHFLGSGIYGSNCSPEDIYNKRLSKETLKFFKIIEQKGGTFSCRDVLSYIVMKNNGLSSVYLTGCPAWYDFEHLDFVDSDANTDIKKILISDPGVTKKYEEQETRANQAVDVIRMVCDRFPNAQIHFTFNNGINTKYSSVCNNIIYSYLKNAGIAVTEFMGAAQGFSVYDDADIHIGFRVHSHIYSLSKRIPSILIEEDLRGYGMNETLGLPHITSFNMQSKVCAGGGVAIYMRLTDI